MRKTFTICLISGFLLTGCAGARDSNLNPFNWFGRSQEIPVEQTDGGVNPLIPRSSGLLRGGRRARLAKIDLTTPIATVTDVRIERVPGGAIIRAKGADPMQGAFNVELVPETKDEIAVDGVLTYSLERQRPSEPRPAGTIQTREVIAARHVTDQTLSGVRTIRVVAAQNARQVRRR